MCLLGQGQPWEGTWVKIREAESGSGDGVFAQVSAWLCTVFFSFLFSQMTNQELVLIGHKSSKTLQVCFFSPVVFQLLFHSLPKCPSSPRSDLRGFYTCGIVLCPLPKGSLHTCPSPRTRANFIHVAADRGQISCPGVSSSKSSWAITPSLRCKGRVATIPSVLFPVVPTTLVPSAPWFGDWWSSSCRCAPKRGGIRGWEGSSSAFGASCSQRQAGRRWGRWGASGRRCSPRGTAAWVDDRDPRGRGPRQVRAGRAHGAPPNLPGTGGDGQCAGAAVDTNTRQHGAAFADLTWRLRSDSCFPRFQQRPFD